jgi:hypothetical protein
MADGVEIATLVIASLLLVSFWFVMIYLYRDRQKLVACIRQVNKLCEW